MSPFYCLCHCPQLIWVHAAVSLLPHSSHEMQLCRLPGSAGDSSSSSDVQVPLSSACSLGSREGVALGLPSSPSPRSSSQAAVLGSGGEAAVGVPSPFMCLLPAPFSNVPCRSGGSNHTLLLPPLWAAPPV